MSAVQSLTMLLCHLYLSSTLVVTCSEKRSISSNDQSVNLIYQFPFLHLSEYIKRFMHLWQDVVMIEVSLVVQIFTCTNLLLASFRNGHNVPMYIKIS